MAKQLSFKEYLESKEKLREAVDNVPQRTAEYTLRKYCKLVVGENKESKIYVPLKPKQKVLVEAWLAIAGLISLSMLFVYLFIFISLYAW